LGHLAAQHIASNYITTMTDSTKAILTNKAVLAIDQDAYGLQGVPITRSSIAQTAVWGKPE